MLGSLTGILVFFKVFETVPLSKNHNFCYQTSIRKVFRSGYRGRIPQDFPHSSWQGGCVLNILHLCIGVIILWALWQSEVHLKPNLSWHIYRLQIDFVQYLHWARGCRHTHSERGWHLFQPTKRACLHQLRCLVLIFENFWFFCDSCWWNSGMRFSNKAATQLLISERGSWFVKAMVWRLFLAISVVSKLKWTIACVNFRLSWIAHLVIWTSMTFCWLKS